MSVFFFFFLPAVFIAWFLYDPTARHGSLKSENHSLLSSPERNWLRERVGRELSLWALRLAAGRVALAIGAPGTVQ